MQPTYVITKLMPLEELERMQKKEVHENNKVQHICGLSEMIWIDNWSNSEKLNLQKTSKDPRKLMQHPGTIGKYGELPPANK